MTNKRRIPIGIVQDKFAFPDGEGFLQLACSIGAQRVELKYESFLDTKYDLRGKTAWIIKKQAQECAIGLSVHAPYEEGVSFGDPDPKVRENTRKQMSRCIEFADAIGAEYITVHGGAFEIEPEPLVKATLGQPQRVFLRDLVQENDLNALKERTYEDLDWFFHEVNRRGMVPALENFHDFSNFKVRYPIIPEDFKEIGEVLGDSFSINYDTGHGHSTGIHILKFIKAIGVSNIMGTHLHDNHQLGDEHLPIYQGTVDFDAFFRAYKENHWDFPLNIEVKNLEDLLQSWRSLNRVFYGVGEEVPSIQLPIRELP